LEAASGIKYKEECRLSRRRDAVTSVRRIELITGISTVRAETGMLLPTRAWLADQPAGRFEFTFTPKHGSWLNLVEGFFSKLARSVLRHIRGHLQTGTQGSPHGGQGPLQPASRRPHMVPQTRSSRLI
jgi:hypothetical protein